MQKSTPLSQLPSVSFPTQTQMMPSSTPSFLGPPQPSASANEALNENPTTIQDALESLNAIGNNQDTQGAEEFVDEYPPTYNPDMVDDILPPGMENTPPDIDMKSKLINDVLSWNNDLKYALYATAIFLFLNLIPIENYIYPYIALNKIPHSGLLIKSVLMFIAVLLIFKVM